ncbi:MAG: small lipoprotein [Leptospiraceae bacterium]|nr:small lipoprotein [Leptospiraceae bacterium]
MKSFFLTLILLTSISCANIYSPTGIKGKDALKEIEELRGTLSFSSIALLLSTPSSSFSPTTSSSVVCSTDGIPSISPLASSTSASNFSIPNDSNTFVDLSAPGGTVYFRSQPLTSSPNGLFIQVASIRTPTITTAGTCSYSVSAANCGTSDLSGISYSTSATFVFTNNCLAVRCTTPALVRIRQGNSSLISFDSTSFLLNLASPEIFTSTTGIKDDTYYTRDSFDKCKQDIASIGLLQIADVSNSIQKLSVAVPCNLPFSSAAPSLNSAGYSVLEGNACKLEPVSFIGL